METKTQWENEKVFITLMSFPNKSYLSFSDRTDYANMPSGYSQNVRGLKKAIEFLNNGGLEKDDTFYGIITKLDCYKLNIHTYCAMD